MKQKVFIFLLLFLFFGKIFSQEVVTFTGSHNNYKNNNKNNELSDTLEIPFFSDFSENNPLKFYQDNFVSIATNQTILPPSIGAAQFDALNNNNEFYSDAYNISIVADYLTSKPINLNYTQNDSVFLSFFYQPKGLLDPPSENDSLVLQFYAPQDSTWENVWFADNINDVEFKQVFIKIDQEKFLKKGFKFRFYNKISMASQTYPSFVTNCDFWFIDYIYINKNRNFNDVSKNDIAFQQPISFKIDQYQTIPYKHYLNSANNINHNLKIIFRNNDDNLRDIDTMYIVFEDKNNQIPNDTLKLGSYTLVPNNNSNIEKNNISFKFHQNQNFDYISYNMITKLVTDSYDSTSNNIIKQTKKLGTVYSYDDATCENAYGLYGDGTLYSYVAQKYYTYKNDKISGINLYINKTFENHQPYYFYAIVWENNPNTGKPGDIVYEQAGLEIKTEKLNNFQILEFDESVSVTDTFYIGWMKTTEEIMNIGIDKNFSEENKKYYSIYNGVWEQSSIDGIFMMQPIFGNVNWAKDEKKSVSENLKIYPNPADDFINIQIKNHLINPKFQVFIFDITGKNVFKKTFHKNLFQIDLSNFKSGIYSLKIISENIVFNKKIIKK